jgi:hypothetical protein
MSDGKSRGLMGVGTAHLEEHPPGFEQVQRYLHSFGYLSKDNITGTLDAATSEALVLFQHFGNLSATGAFDESTREQMSQPRCGMPDSSVLEFYLACEWRRDELTFAFDAGSSDTSGESEFSAVRSAFSTWQTAGSFEGLPLLRFREVPLLPNVPDIIVGWRPAQDVDLSMVGSTIAHADYPPGCSFIGRGSLPLPIHFDSTESSWSIGAQLGAFDVETVALHEIGHAVGLAHSTVVGAVMWPFASTNTMARSLSQDDVDGYKALYVKHVPGVIGASAKDAVQAIRSARLTPSVRGASGRDLYCVGQTPAAGTAVRRGSQVILDLRREGP